MNKGIRITGKRLCRRYFGYFLDAYQGSFDHVGCQFLRQTFVAQNQQQTFLAGFIRGNSRIGKQRSSTKNSGQRIQARFENLRDFPQNIRNDAEPGIGILLNDHRLLDFAISRFSAILNRTNHVSNVEYRYRHFFIDQIADTIGA